MHKKEYANKLDEATEKLRDILRENARVAQENVKKSQEAAQAANQEWEKAQQIASLEADSFTFPDSIKQGPTATV